ncbi:SdrD B-like domain-containing protein [Chloroflexus sp. Y-396-1]|uniref:SdrD B-like domain-containing protein n=1 Tax=Chloroflexus sp. Y-396-1 TaxID=867845 RepID=UPI0004AF3C37|nr:SdrD B-like domain-containing protein [Chloroflexus sp. Y-396-1]
MAQPLVFKRGTAKRFYSGFIVTLILGFLFSVVMSVFAAGTLTVQVYLDSDRDGTFDSGETGISGVLVSVYSAESVIVGLNTTDSNGQVVFPSLPDGNYRIEVSNLGARVVSVPGNDNPGLLSFVTISGGAVTQRIGLRELDGGSVDTGAPVGTRSISVRVWDDSDADGIQDASEPSLSGLPVRLVDSLGNLVSGPVNTDALGRATFNNAPTGAGYRVRILAADIPSGYILTQAFVNDGDPNPTIRDSNAVLVSGNVEATLPSTGRGVNIDSVDIGFTRGAVSGFLWRDNDRDGLWDSGEPRLNGVTVQLVDTSTSTVISTTTTRQRIGSTQPEDGGIFVFPSLPLTTTYQVVIPNSQFASGAPLFGAANSPSVAGGDVGLQDGIPGTNDVTGPVLTVNATTNVYSDQRFGFYKGVVGDFVWLDDDSDSNQDPGEIGVNGVIVFVDADNDGIRDSGELFTVTTNNPNNGQPGYYLFDDLPLGSSYRITLDPDNFKAGGALVGLGNSTGTAATNGNGDFYVYQVSSTLNEASPQNIIIDFGLYQLAQISGQVFFDGANAPADNAASGEPGVGSVTVRLRDGSDAIITTTTTLPDGTFTISNVALGTYRLEFVNPDATNFSFVAADTADNRVASIVSNNGRTALFTVNASNQSIVRSAALIGKSTVNGITFVDQAYDGQRSGDPALANVTVNLTATVALPNLTTTITRSTTTDSSGNYSFGGLPGGTGAVTFTLSFTPPPATPPYQVTQADVGADATDSDGAADLTDQPLGVGTTASRDQGYYQNVTVQARVFEETATINNTF